jgi:hypothetical protein
MSGLNLKSRCASSTTTNKSTKRQPQKWLKIHDIESTQRYLKYSLDRSREPFNVEQVIETMNDEGIADIWIHELRLRMKHDLGPFDFVFQNSPLTEGSEAHKFVQNYMSELITTGWITRAQLRHLPLTGTRSIPPGESLALEEISSPEFIQWISRETNGLIRLKLIQRKDATTFIDYAIKEIA